jgi:endoglucanase
MTAAADAIHPSVPDVLIFFGGLNLDTDISPIPLGRELTGTDGASTAGQSATFIPSDFAYEKKIALELYKYDFEMTQAACSDFIGGFYNAGFQALEADNPDTVYTFPVAITEWGFKQD